MEANELLNTYSDFAVIGVTTDPEKYGYKIYQCLKRHHYHVSGISYAYKEVEGDPLYPSLLSVPQKIDVAVFVVSPKHGYEYIKQCLDLDIRYVWLQPGTYDDDFLAYLDTLPVHYYLDCVLRRLEP